MHGKLPVKKCKKVLRQMFSEIGCREEVIRDAADWFIPIRHRGGRDAFIKMVQRFIDDEMDYGFNCNYL